MVVRRLTTEKYILAASGQSLVEYALILALVSVLCASTLTTLGQNVSKKLGDVGQALETTGSNGADGGTSDEI